MAEKRLSKEEFNFLKYALIVFDEFPKMLRCTFVQLWNNKIASLPGNQLWENTSVSVRERIKAKISTDKSFEDWDCTDLFKATIYSKTFATSTTPIKTLKDQFIVGKITNPFHFSPISPTGNRDETMALAIDQIRLLRNTLCHSPQPTMTKATFDCYVELAKDAFDAVGFPTCGIDDIGNLEEEEFPTEKVNELNRKIRDLELENEFLKGDVSRKLTALVDDSERNKEFQESMKQRMDMIEGNYDIIRISHNFTNV